MHPSTTDITILLLAIGANVRGVCSFLTPSLITHKSLSDPNKSRLLYKTSDTVPPTPVSTVTQETPAIAETKTLPKIIQGGMGVRISSWKLAREVSNRGEMGVISGTAMDAVFVRTLQDGDPGGHFRRALASFPNQAMAQEALDKYFIPEGKAATKPYRSLPLWSLEPPRKLEEATILGSYCEIWLAKHNDDGSPTGGLVGINRLTKVAMPTIHSLYGAMLADVDYVIMGAGIPAKIPGILDALAEHRDCLFTIDVSGSAEDDEHAISFSPKHFWKSIGTPKIATKQLRRPAFLPIVSSTTLAQSLLKRSNGVGPTRGIDGFVVELNQAGGHNAPPRGWHFEPEDHDEPKYGAKDYVDIEKFGKVAKGLPFWFAGSYGRKEKLVDVLNAGGTGVQAGTLFALADESGMDESTKRAILAQLAEQGELKVFTDPAASPTGFPFKVLELENDPSLTTLSDPEVYEARQRVCNLGYLRTPFIQTNGKVGYKCPSEPVADYVAKGGDEAATVGRKCLCNALCADAGFPQVRFINNPETGKKEVYVEKSLITMGDDVNICASLMKKREDGTWGYTAADVIDYLYEDFSAYQEMTEALSSDSIAPPASVSSLEAAEYLLEAGNFELLPSYVPEDKATNNSKTKKKYTFIVDSWITEHKHIESDKVKPIKWGYSSLEVAEDLLNQWNEFHRQLEGASDLDLLPAL